MTIYPPFMPNPLADGVDLCAPRIFTDGRSRMLFKREVLLPTEAVRGG